MNRILLLMLLITAGCTTSALQDEEPQINPYKPVNVIAVEMIPGNLVCVTEGENPPQRTCVPVVHENDGNPG